MSNLNKEVGGQTDDEQVKQLTNLMSNLMQGFTQGTEKGNENDEPEENKNH